MAVSYLKKTKMYEIAKSLGLHDMPKLKDCNYSFSHGAEWLTFSNSEYYVKLSVLFAGAWIKLFMESDGVVVRDEVLKKMDLMR